MTTEELIAVALTPGGRPEKAPQDVDCAWRPFALEYAAHIQPWLSAPQLSAIHDSLFYGTGCNSSAADALLAAHAPSARPLAARAAAAPAVYVDPTAGSDSNPGTQALPLKTLAGALAAARTARAGSGAAPFSIVLRAGTHHLAATLHLTPSDSGLAFQAFPGEAPVVSGALPVELTWALASNSTPGAWGAVQNDTNAVFGDCPGPQVPDMGPMPSWQACQAACQGNATCTAWTYHTPACADCGAFIGHCCFRTDGAFPAKHQAGVVSQGRGGGRAAIWAAPLPLPQGLPPQGLQALLLNGHRATLARYPNANPETDLFPTGYIMDSAWLPSVPGAVSNYTLTVDLAPLGLEDAGRGVYVNYTIGYGGNAARYDPPRAYWASQDFGPRHAQPTATCDRWEEMHLRSPSGLDTGSSLAGRLPYATTSQLIVGSWRLAHWYSWFFGVAAINGSVLTFGEPGPIGGGHQGGEGCEEGQEYFVQGVKEELDAPNEFWHDPVAGVLYLAPNASDAGPDGSPPASLSLPFLHTFFSLAGSEEDPVRNVSWTTLRAGAPPLWSPGGSHLVGTGRWSAWARCCWRAQRTCP
jgi:hypothetical protein